MTGGFFKAPPDWSLKVAKGLVPGHTFVEKFGENPDVDTGTVPEDLWSHGGLYTFSTTADIDSIGSTSVADTQEITVQGLDADWDLITQSVNLNGQTRVAMVWAAFSSDKGSGKSTCSAISA